MKTLLILTMFLSPWNLAHADHWVIPPTGIVDFSQGQQALPTFSVPQPVTVNYPLPQWSNPTPPPMPEMPTLPTCCEGY